MGLKSTGGGGEIVQVQGGHIIRATGRKDRHSKVFTAKGPRDRRVRLSAHTAIQFYDVQDRLGYDRPSKAVDWLIKKAKASIDKLAELPPWDPCATTSNANNVVDGGNNNVVGCSEDIPVGDHTGSYHHLHSSNNAYVPQGVGVGVGVDSQSLADSIKSFFPTNNTTSEDHHHHHHNPMSFQSYPHELISRESHHQNQNQDLCLSLHTVQDPGPGGDSGGHHPHSSTHHHHVQEALFQGFDGGSGGGGVWAEQQEMGRFTRLMGWAGSGGGGGGGGGVGEGRGGSGVLFNPPSQLQPPQAFSAYSQRGTLQSSYSHPLVRALEDHHNHHHSSISGLGPGSDGFMGFGMPSSQLHGHELHGGANSMSNNRASSSSLSPDSSQH